MLKERDERGGNRDHLTRRDVHVLNVCSRDGVNVTVLDAHQDAFLSEATLGVKDRIGLGDGEPVFLIGGQVVDLVGDLAIDDAPVRGLNEPEGIDPGE